ncbi:MAG: UDP-N-acetylmuramate dehydrogenase [Gammaproteobacteria bacterium]|nr:UDP-N-acetylmuramate dehydrogenase [Gammaproteobacteria bacterium]
MNTGLIAESRTAGRLLKNEPMALHTSWRAGGPAEMFFSPASLDDLAAFLRSLAGDEPVLWLGLGSNLLVRDGGLKGVVIATHRVLRKLERVGDHSVRAEAGVPCAKLARHCARWGLGPAEFFAGIPGTVGGALAMNAGAFGGETWQHVVDVDVIDRSGEIVTRGFGEYRVGYRSVEGPAEEWFLAATLRFEQDPQASPQAIRDLLARRKAAQPIGSPSCGSVFRNPPGRHAAELIETAGLKGHHIGDAVVSDKHANFIINRGHATAAQIEALIGLVVETVEREHGIRLETEVRIVGDPA